MFNKSKILTFPSQSFVIQKYFKKVALILISTFTFYSFPCQSAIVNLSNQSTVNETSHNFNEINKELQKLENVAYKGSTRYQSIQLARQGAYNFLNNNSEQAIKDLNQAWTMEPDLTIAGIMIAIIHLQEKSYDLALEVAQKIQQAHPTGYTLAGLAYAGMEKHDQAKSAFKQAIAIRPHEVNAILNLAIYEINDKNYNEARKLYDQLLQFQPDNTHVLLLKSELEFQSGHAKQGLALLEKVVEKNPEGQLQALVKLANIYLSTKQFKKSLILTEPALERNPDNFDLMNLVAVAYLQLGTPQKAIPLLKKATTNNPNATLPHYNLALAYERLGEYEYAMQEADKALKISPNHTSSKFVKASLLAQTGQLDSAKKLLQKLSSAYPKSADIKELEGKVAIAQKQPEKAVAFYQQALKSSQTSNLTIQLALAQIQSGDHFAGQATFQNWLKKHPEDLLTRITLADLLLAQGKLNEAQQQYTKIVHQQPDLAGAQNNLAWLLLQKGKLNDAIKHAEKAHKLEPDNARVMDTLSMIYLKKGDNPQKAIQLLRQAINILPNDMNVNFHLAQALSQTASKTEAKLILAELLSKNVKFSEYQQAQELLKKLEAEALN